MFKSIKDKIISFIYPKKCIFCSEIIPNDKIICKFCKGKVCTDTKIEIISNIGEKIISCISVFKYTDDIRRILLKFKFSGYRYYSEFFSEILAEEIIKNKIDNNIDIVTCVPLSRNRKIQRGYNQSELVAKLVAKNINIEYKDTLTKIKDNPEQHKLAYDERFKNVKNVYKIKNIQDIYQKNILICDDIVTTGSTLRECCKILIKNGANSVVCCAIARA